MSSATVSPNNITNVYEVNYGSDLITLAPDPAAEYPIYIYISRNGNIVLYSRDIVSLLNHPKVERPLVVSSWGVSFLLQSSVIPPPWTIYEQIYTLNVGDSAKIVSRHNRINLEFDHKYPFLTGRSPDASTSIFPAEDVLNLLAQSVSRRIDTSKPTYLFHSGGKDSNTIALALAEAGYQKDVTLISHRSRNDSDDESEKSKKIAKHLGFRHKKLNEHSLIDASSHQAIAHLYQYAPFPCLDTVSLAYPLYTVAFPALLEGQILDGGGNDVYMGIPPKQRELYLLSYLKYAPRPRLLRSYASSIGRTKHLLKSEMEIFGYDGWSLSDARLIYPSANFLSNYYDKATSAHVGGDVVFFKSDVFGTKLVPEMHLRKARNFSHAFNVPSFFPFMDESVADVLSQRPESELFDRKTLQNKLALRNLLLSRLGLDYSKGGSQGYRYGYRALYRNNRKIFLAEINRCPYWDAGGIAKLLARAERWEKKGGRAAGISETLLFRLGLLSGWLNHNIYIKNIR